MLVTERPVRTTEGCPVLECKNVEIRYGSAVAVNSLSLNVADGEAIVVLGPNGAGKSTLLNGISGLVPLSDGSIALRGKSLKGLPAPRVARLGLTHVPERREMFPDLTVLENLQVSSDNLVEKSRRRESLERIFDTFPFLADRKASLAGVLSGGQQQILAIARAILPEPDLLLLDEPTLGLSPKYSEDVLSTLLDLKQKRTTMMLVEQKAHLGLRFADRGYVMVNGKIVMSGSSDELAREPLVAAYLGAA